MASLHGLSVPDVDTLKLMLKDPNGCAIDHTPRRIEPLDRYKVGYGFGQKDGCSQLKSSSKRYRKQNTRTRVNSRLMKAITGGQKLEDTRVKATHKPYRSRQSFDSISNISKLTNTTKCDSCNIQLKSNTKTGNLLTKDIPKVSQPKKTASSSIKSQINFVEYAKAGKNNNKPWMTQAMVESFDKRLHKSFLHRRASANKFEIRTSENTLPTQDGDTNFKQVKLIESSIPSENYELNYEPQNNLLSKHKYEHSPELFNCDFLKGKNLDPIPESNDEQNCDLFLEITKIKQEPSHTVDEVEKWNSISFPTEHYRPYHSANRLQKTAEKKGLDTIDINKCIGHRPKSVSKSFSCGSLSYSMSNRSVAIFNEVDSTLTVTSDIEDSPLPERSPEQNMKQNGPDLKKPSSRHNEQNEDLPVTKHIHNGDDARIILNSDLFNDFGQANHKPLSRSNANDVNQCMKNTSKYGYYFDKHSKQSFLDSSEAHYLPSSNEEFSKLSNETIARNSSPVSFKKKLSLPSIPSTKSLCIKQNQSSNSLAIKRSINKYGSENLKQTYMSNFPSSGMINYVSGQHILPMNKKESGYFQRPRGYGNSRFSAKVLENRQIGLAKAMSVSSIQPCVRPTRTQIALDKYRKTYKGKHPELSSCKSSVCSTSYQRKNSRAQLKSIHQDDNSRAYHVQSHTGAPPSTPVLQGQINTKSKALSIPLPPPAPIKQNGP